jgi:hypothetical protein
MTEDSVEAAVPIAEPAVAEPAKPESEGALEHAKSSVIHAVEAVVEKVTDTLGSIGGRK